MRKRLAVLFLAALVVCPLAAQTVRVGLEPLPPLVNEDGTGLTITMLREIEKASSLRFTIQIMPYNRAKSELAGGNLDLIGHTPYGLETAEFYAFAQELVWKEDLATDFYALKKPFLDNPEKGKVGIPRGNKEFASDLTGIAVANFYEEDLRNLVPLLVAGRIDAIWFERGSVMTTIRKLGVSGVLYRQAPKELIPAGIAVRKNAAGDQLKAKIEEALKKVELAKIFADNRRFLKMPDSGTVGN